MFRNLLNCLNNTIFFSCSCVKST